MRLKVSPKAALESIDRLIYEGFQLEREHGDALRKGLAVTITDTDRKEISDWYDKVVKTLRSIFLDFAPVFFLWKSVEDVKVEPKEDLMYRPMMRRNDKDYVRMLEGSLQILGEYFRQLSDQVFTPLFYIPSKSQICFFASVSSLMPDSNESTLCKHMFQRYNYHEWVEMDDIFADAFGGNRDEYSVKEKTKIKNAVDGVNRKTNEAFGFPVFRVKKSLISINLPSRFLREERREMA